MIRGEGRREEGTEKLNKVSRTAHCQLSIDLQQRQQKYYTELAEVSSDAETGQISDVIQTKAYLNSNVNALR